jgi:hypothetical protein
VSELSAPRRVRRVRGLLWPGFSKRFAEGHGTTYLWGVPIGRFHVVAAADDTAELRYLRWPIVDVIHGDPLHDAKPLAASGYLRAPRGRRIRFCDFLLERGDD